MLKIFSVFVAAVVAVNAGTNEEIKAMQQLMIQNMQVCVSALDMDMKVLNNFDIKTPITDTKTACFFACMAKKIKVMNDNNTINKEKLTKFLEPIEKHFNEHNLNEIYTNISNVINTCVAAQPQEKEECEAVKIAHKCIVENAKKVGLFDSSF